MLSKRVVLNAKNGLHARPAGELVKLIKSLDGQIWFVTDARRVNGSSMLSLLSLGLRCGSEFEVQAEGGSEAKNMQQVEDFIATIKE